MGTIILTIFFTLALFEILSQIVRLCVGLYVLSKGEDIQGTKPTLTIMIFQFITIIGIIIMMGLFLSTFPWGLYFKPLSPFSIIITIVLIFIYPLVKFISVYPKFKNIKRWISNRKK